MKRFLHLRSIIAYHFIILSEIHELQQIIDLLQMAFTSLKILYRLEHDWNTLFYIYKTERFLTLFRNHWCIYISKLTHFEGVKSPSYWRRVYVMWNHWLSVGRHEICNFDPRHFIIPKLCLCENWNISIF